jgi:hypothetical protein
MKLWFCGRSSSFSSMLGAILVLGCWGQLQPMWFLDRATRRVHVAERSDCDYATRFHITDCASVYCDLFLIYEPLQDLSCSRHAFAVQTRRSSLKLAKDSLGGGDL